ncbi:MAG: hypothetical protein MUE40_18590 [Anaerolineae bacterium]|jgi:hypothetical protein|nr:hypothetical protein [Anaerolineae bacterium]
MSIHVRWDDPAQTVLYQTIEGDFTWEEMYQSTEHIHQLLGTVAHKVDALIDLTRMGKVPGAVITHIRPLLEMHPNSGTLVVFGSGTLPRIIGNMLNQLYPQSRNMFIFTPTEAAARVELARIQQQRAQGQG